MVHPCTTEQYPKKYRHIFPKQFTAILKIHSAKDWFTARQSHTIIPYIILYNSIESFYDSMILWLPVVDCKGGAGTCGLDRSCWYACLFQRSTVMDWLEAIMKLHSSIIVYLKNSVPIQSRVFCKLSRIRASTLPLCLLSVSLTGRTR